MTNKSAGCSSKLLRLNSISCSTITNRTCLAEARQGARALLLRRMQDFVSEFNLPVTRSFFLPNRKSFMIKLEKRTSDGDPKWFCSIRKKFYDQTVLQTFPWTVPLYLSVSSRKLLGFEFCRSPHLDSKFSKLVNWYSKASSCISTILNCSSIYIALSVSSFTIVSHWQSYEQTLISLYCFR